MIDKWFKKELDSIYEKHPIVVFIDESKNAKFLLNNPDYTLYEVHSEIDELRVKYEIEKQREEGKKYLIYTQLPKNQLRYVREYCETNGAIEIKYLHQYIKEKVYQALHVNLTMSEEELVSAAFVSIGKSEDYWRKLATGTGDIFDLEKDLLHFLHEPEKYVATFNESTKKQFFIKVNECIGQEYFDKSPITLANELAKAVLDTLLYNRADKILMNIYMRWVDSREYKSSLDANIKSYVIPEGVDIWKVNIAHPFYEVDLQWLKVLVSNLQDKTTLQNHLKKITQRAHNKQAIHMGITFWDDVKTILEFNTALINPLSSLDDCIDFYVKNFYKIDSAMRAIYTQFLDQKELIVPIQEHYKNSVTLFLDKWFKYFPAYQQNQTGVLQRIIDENECKTAVIVGDAVAYELAQNVAKQVSKNYLFTNNIICANFPSVTENNMSQIYIADGHVEKLLEKREVYFKAQNSDKDIGFVYLDNVDENTQHQYLISQYKDIDELGDKMNHKALKYFSEAENYFAQKIEMLFKNGYKKVYLITDHGFVLTGQLSESDKIEVNFNGAKKVDERYITTMDKQKFDDALIVEYPRAYDGYQYIYFAKSMSPFKSVGHYGFSHGGIAPQELITPFLCWENNAVEENSIAVTIANKKELTSVTGELFRIKIEAKAKKKDIFSQTREIQILLFSNGKILEKSDLISLCDGDISNKEFRFGGNDKIDVHVVDIHTKEQLDKTSITQNKARDLGGL